MIVEVYVYRIEIVLKKITKKQEQTVVVRLQYLFVVFEEMV